MATYTKVYNNPYPDGWKDGKDGNTPVTAEILNNQTETLESIEQYLADNPIEQGGGSSGTTDYEALNNKPTINGVEVVGDLSLEDLGITGGGGTGTTNYEDLTNKPSINGIDLQGNLTVEELGLLDITESTDTTLENSKDGILKIKDIYGNTIQDGEPTPDTPIEIESVVLSEIKTTNSDGSLESVATLSEPITMNGFNGVRDNLDRKNFKTVVFDGSENWKVSSVYSTRYYIHFSDTVNNGAVLCTQGIRRDSTINGSIRIDSNLNFSIDTTFTTLDDWKAHLASKPMEVVYELAEPIETPLPDADVEALKSLKTYDGVTHIFTDSEVEPSWLFEYNTTRVGTELDEIDAELVKINKRITDISTTSQINYSTEEQVVGTWIDGKPIYEKVIELDIVIQDTSRWTDTSIDLGEIEVFIKGTVLDIYNQSFPAAVAWIGEPKNIAVLINPSATNCETKYLIVQYTKTTDTV